MAKQRFANEEMKNVIKEIGASVLSAGEETAIDVAIWGDLPKNINEDFTINEFGEVVRGGKQSNNKAKSRTNGSNVISVAKEDIERVRKLVSGSKIGGEVEM